ncbi:MAG: hypothetical protein F7C35_02915 [Desulfurococcales archaeon]|nr:hypothetical protein [Desulfurococcales archaeon]
MAIEETARLLELIKKLDPQHRKVADYFMKYVSVGDLRAVLDLKKLGVSDPKSVIEDLIELGILERGVDCYNISKPLREYIFRKR